MTDIEIPEEAVELAAKAWSHRLGKRWDRSCVGEQDHLRDVVRHLLEAALPALRPVLAPISDEAVERAAVAACEFTYPSKSSMPWADVEDWEQEAWRGTARAALEAAGPVRAVSRERLAEVLDAALDGIPGARWHEDGTGIVLVDALLASGVVQDATTLRQQWAEEVAQAIHEAAERKAIYGAPDLEVDDSYYRASNHAIAIIREYGEAKP